MKTALATSKGRCSTSIRSTALMAEQMQVFHRTFTRNANFIIREGFRDSEGYYKTDSPYLGVWVSDTPLDANEGIWGDVSLAVEVPDTLFEEYEWVEEIEGIRYRESLIPAEMLNRYGPAKVVTGSD